MPMLHQGIVMCCSVVYWSAIWKPSSWKNGQASPQRCKIALEQSHKDPLGWLVCIMAEAMTVLPGLCQCSAQIAETVQRWQRPCSISRMP